MEDTKNLTTEQLLARIAQLEAENKALAAQPKGQRPFRPTKNGALSVGPGVVGVFGVSLYVPQWERFFGLLGIEMPTSMRGFIDANRSVLKFEKPAGHTSALLTELKARVAAKKASA